jgi:glutathione S-transferase
MWIVGPNGQKSLLQSTLQFQFFWAVVRTPKAQQNPQAIAKTVKLLKSRLRIADDQLDKHSYLTGDDFTLADIQLGHMLFDTKTLKLTKQIYKILVLILKGFVKDPRIESML